MEIFMSIFQTAAQIWRDFVTDGVSGSGEWKPKKSEIREWGTRLEDSLKTGAGKQFDTLALFIAASIPADVDYIRTLGYSEAGDAGAAIYLKLDATPSPVKPWHRQSADGAWWEVAKGQPIHVEMFGALSYAQAQLAALNGAGSIDTVAASNVIAFNAALDFIEYLGGGTVNARGQFYVLNGGLLIPDSVELKGAGVGLWDTVYHNRPKTWSGTNLLFKGTGAKSKTVRGITSMKTAGGYRADPNNVGQNIQLTSFMNADASAAVPATPRAFSVGIRGKNRLSSSWTLRGLRLVPWFGTNGFTDYSNQASVGLADDWDGGLLMEDCEYVTIDNVQGVGYWRFFGHAMLNSDFDQFGGQERNTIINSRFQGLNGQIVRAGDQAKVQALTSSTVEVLWHEEVFWPAAGQFTALGSTGFQQYSYTSLSRNGGNLRFNGVTPNPSSPALTFVRAPDRSRGAAGSYFLNVTAAGLDHVNGALASTFGLGHSKAFEISGFPMRGVQFFNFKAQTHERCVAFLHDCYDGLFVNSQFEGGGDTASCIIASPVLTSSVAAAPAGDTRNLRFLSTIMSNASLVAFTPRSMWDDIRQSNEGGLDADFHFKALPGQDFIVDLQTSKSFTVKTTGGATPLRVTDSGNVSIEGGGQLSLSGGAAYINAETGQNLNIRNGTTNRLQLFGASGNWGAGVDNAQTWGSAAFRFLSVYSVNSALQTSDEREKRDIEPIPDDWLDAWGDVEWVRYRWKDGDERWYVGLIAQRVQKTFAAHGIDALGIGLLSYEEWDDHLGPDGELLAPAGNRYGLSYDQCLALEVAHGNRRLKRLEARIASMPSR